jgi:hypothetical protein
VRLSLLAGGVHLRCLPFDDAVEMVGILVATGKAVPWNR